MIANDHGEHTNHLGFVHHPVRCLQQFGMHGTPELVVSLLEVIILGWLEPPDVDIPLLFGNATP